MFYSFRCLVFCYLFEEVTALKIYQLDLIDPHHNAFQNLNLNIFPINYPSFRQILAAYSQNSIINSVF